MNAATRPTLSPPGPSGPALDGEAFALESNGARLQGYAGGPRSGVPLLLVHSINAAGSAREMRPLFEHYRRERPVFAFDLPGFGASDRSDRVYTPRLMTDAVHAVVRHVREVCGPDAFDALALSLSCEFLARAASEDAPALRSVALVSPTGFSGRTPPVGPPGSTRAVPGLHAALAVPLWSGLLYRGLTRPGVIRYFLEKTWGSRAIDEDLWRYDVQITREPGAKHAPLYFLSGGLFSRDIGRVYAAPGMPVWMAHGTRGDFVDYRGKAAFADRPNWRFDVFESGALPFFEHPEDFCRRYDAFIAALPPRP